MARKVWESKYRNTIICIDSYEKSVPVGRITNPFLGEPAAFYGIIDFLKKLTKMLDDMQFPQAFMSMRTFSAPTPESQTEPQLSESADVSGKLATFHLSVIFRQNASWQGTLCWVDGRQEESFRSVLELINLMDSALSA